MNYLLSIDTDVGIKKSTNQDSAALLTANTEQGKVVFGMICDGMGGLEKGELASATVVRAFIQWFHEQFPTLLYSGLSEDELRAQWEQIIARENNRIMAFGREQGVNLGTTATLLLIADNRYYVMNVGDTRAYEIVDNGIQQLTHDQTVVAREVMLGNMTAEQARMDPRRNVLLQCIGASNVVIPDFIIGDAKQNAVYVLCSDGFRNEISDAEIFESFRAELLLDEASMHGSANRLIELNKSRNELDNITVALVRTY